MLSFLGFLKRLILPVIATVVIVLAVLVGVARLLLPQVPQYREDIQRLAEEATGFQVDFGQISAGISFYGPELRLQQTRIVLPDEELEVVYAEEVNISLDLAALVFRQLVLPSRTEIRGVRVDFVRDSEGLLFVQGRTPAEWLQTKGEGNLQIEDIPDTSLWLSDVIVGFDDQFLDRPPTEFLIEVLEANLDDGVLTLDGQVEPEVRFGDDISFFAEGDLAPLLDPEKGLNASAWQLRLDIPDLDIAQWVSLLPDEMSPVVNGVGEARVFADLIGGLPQAVTADLDLRDLVIVVPGAEPIVYEQVSGSFDLSQRDGDWNISGRDLVLRREDQRWPTGSFSAQLSLDDSRTPEAISLDASFVNLDNLMPLARAFANPQLKSFGINGWLGGELRDVRIRADLKEGKLAAANVSARFQELSFFDAALGVDVRGVSGSIDASLEKGQLALQVEEGRFVLESLFRGPVNADVLNALFVWRTNQEGLTILGSGIELETPYGSGVADLTLFQSVDADQGLVIDLSATASSADVRGAIPNLPIQIPAVILDWLEIAVVAGEVEGAQFKLQGDLSKFPYVTPDDGVFKITVPFSKGQFAFAPDWPTLKSLSGELVFDGVSMYSTRNVGEVSGTAFSDVSAQMNDMRTGVLDIEADVETDLSAVVRLLLESPISKSMGTVLNDVTASGSVSGDLKLHIPVKSLETYDLVSNVVVSDATVRLRGIEYPVTKINGPLTVRRTQLSADAIKGQFLGQPVHISMRHPSEAEEGLIQIVAVEGTTPVADMAEVLKLPFPDRYSGDVSWQARALFPSVKEDTTRQFQILLETDMEGMAIDLPPPLMKAAATIDPLTASITFPQPGRFEVFVSARSGLAGMLRFENEESIWNMDRAAIEVGGLMPKMPQESGVVIGGTFDELLVLDWVGLASGYEEVAGDEYSSRKDFIREISLRAESLILPGYRFPESRVEALQIDSVWHIDIAGPRATGRLTVPSDFTGGIPLRADMSRLTLIDDLPSAEATEDEELADPRDFPRMVVGVQEFAIDDLNFGTLDAEVERVERGLKSKRIETKNDTFAVSIEGDWYITDPVNLTHRSRMRMNMDSTDVAATLSALGYEPLIVAKTGNANADLTWNGPPGMGMLYESKGSFGFRVEKGQILNVEPGGGRFLGLLSLTSLPRRLSLDFRDVFDDGLGFDKLKGSFTLNEGQAYTCDVAMDGSVTDMAIIGRSSIVDREYDQLVVVRPHVSNMVPLGTAVVAGPAVGAAVWLISAIFKDSLSSIGASYYQVSDSWDDPTIEKISKQDIDTSTFADCRASLPEFSLEDTASLQDLRFPQEIIDPEPTKWLPEVPAPEGGVEAQ